MSELEYYSYYGMSEEIKRLLVRTVYDIPACQLQNMFDNAAYRGHKEILEYLHIYISNNHNQIDYSRVMTMATLGGHEAIAMPYLDCGADFVESLSPPRPPNMPEGSPRSDTMESGSRSCSREDSPIESPRKSEGKTLRLTISRRGSRKDKRKSKKDIIDLRLAPDRSKTKL